MYSIGGWLRSYIIAPLPLNAFTGFSACRALVRLWFGAFNSLSLDKYRSPLYWSNAMIVLSPCVKRARTHFCPPTILNLGMPTHDLHNAVREKDSLFLCEWEKEVEIRRQALSPK